MRAFDSHAAVNIPFALKSIEPSDSNRSRHLRQWSMIQTKQESTGTLCERWKHHYLKQWINGRHFLHCTLCSNLNYIIHSTWYIGLRCHLQCCILRRNKSEPRNKKFINHPLYSVLNKLVPFWYKLLRVNFSSPVDCHISDHHLFTFIASTNLGAFVRREVDEMILR